MQVEAVVREARVFFDCVRIVVNAKPMVLRLVLESHIKISRCKHAFLILHSTATELAWQLLTIMWPMLCRSPIRNHLLGLVINRLNLENITHDCSYHISEPGSLRTFWFLNALGVRIAFHFASPNLKLSGHETTRKQSWTVSPPVRLHVAVSRYRNDRGRWNLCRTGYV